MGPLTKVCFACSVSKPLTEFGRHSAKKDGLHYNCKACVRKRSRKWNAENAEQKRRARREYVAKNPEKVKASQGKWRRANAERVASAKRERRVRHHGLSRDGWDAMLEAQGGACATCRSPEPGGRWNSWAVDHDHACCPGASSCGKCVRGLLCNKCNMALGLLHDSKERLLALVEYLDRNAVRQ